MPLIIIDATAVKPGEKFYPFGSEETARLALAGGDLDSFESSIGPSRGGSSHAIVEHPTAPERAPLDLEGVDLDEVQGALATLENWYADASITLDGLNIAVVGPARRFDGGTGRRDDETLAKVKAEISAIDTLREAAPSLLTEIHTLREERDSLRLDVEVTRAAYHADTSRQAARIADLTADRAVLDDVCKVLHDAFGDDAAELGARIHHEAVRIATERKERIALLESAVAASIHHHDAEEAAVFRHDEDEVCPMPGNVPTEGQRERLRHQEHVEGLYSRLHDLGGSAAIREATDHAGLGEGFGWGTLTKSELEALRVALRIRLMDVS